MADDNGLFHGRVGSGNQWMYLQRNAEQESKIIEQKTKKYIDAVNAKEAAVRASEGRLNRLKAQGAQVDKSVLAAAKEAVEKANAEKLIAESELQSKRVEIQKNAQRAAEIYEQNRYKQMSKREQMQYQRDVQAKLKIELQGLKEKEAAYIAEQQRLSNIMKSSTASAEEKEQAKKSYDNIEIQKTSVSSNIGSVSGELDKVTRLTDAMFDKFATRAEKAKASADAYSEAEQKRAEAIAESEAAQNDLFRAIANGADEGIIEKLQKEADTKKDLVKSSTEAAQVALNQKQANEELVKSYETLEDKQKKAKQQQEEFNGMLKKLALSSLSSLVGNMDQSIESLYGHQGKLNAYLQGTEDRWEDLVKNTVSTIGYHPSYSSKAIVDNMSKLIEHGISYNIEMRAFLATTAENVAATFDAANGTLLRLIRIQQADTTAARLGMESSLTKLFNSSFQDSSYLADNISESVTQAILDASMTMDKNSSLEFEYTIQKWLGSLYSLGMSSEGIGHIASAINYLGTGNVTALNSNTPLQTILALSATRSGGKSYADLLTSGLNAEETNKLLKAMVEYLAEIAASQTNMVTKSAYAELFGMSITDMSSFASLTEQELESIYNTTVTYDTLWQDVNTQLAQINNNKSTVQLLNTILENVGTGAGVTMAEVPGVYMLWSALNFLKSSGIPEIKVPGIPNLDLLNVATIAIQGMGLVGSIVGALSSIGKSPSSLDSWKFNEYTRRGQGLSILSSANSSASSSSLSEQLAVSGDTEDIEVITMQQASEQKQDFESVVGESWSSEENVYNAIVDDSSGEPIITVTQEIRDLLKAAGAPSSSVGSGSSLDASGNEEPSSSPPENASGGGESSSGASSGGGSLSNAVQDSEIYNKIYDAISEGESVNVLTVLQEISDKLAFDRVFYTGITCATSGGISGSIQDMSSHIHHSHFHDFSMSAGVTSTDKETSNNVVSKGELLNKQYSENMQEIITAAVETAIRNISGYSTGTGLPVTVTNLNNYGGGF